MIADTTDIKFSCSNCGQHMVVHKSAAGLGANCPICEHPVVVPDASSIRGGDYGGETRAREAGEPESSAKRTSFADPDSEQTRDDLFDAAAETGRLERDLAEAKSEIARYVALFKKAVDECERLTANTTHAQAEIKSFQADRQQLKSDLAQAKQRALATENKVAEVQAKADELAGVLAVAGADNAELQERMETHLAIGRECLSAAEARLKTRESELRESRMEGNELMQALAVAQAELAGLRSGSAETRCELERIQTLLAEAEQTSRRLVDTEKQLQGKLQTAEDECKNLSRDRDQLRQETEGLRHDLAELDNGRELLALRSRIPQIEDERDRAAAALAETTAEAKMRAETEQRLLRELHESVVLREDAERRADVAAEHQMSKDNEVLRGIVERQNETLRVHHIEVRRYRRSRYASRILYAAFGLALVALAIFAVMVFAPHGVGRLFRH